MTYEEAVQKIDSLLVFGSKPGLERVSELIQRIGSPDKKLKFVHVAGTNGKGSTCSFIASALTASGYKTGLFISPYVLEFRERFMIDHQMIPKEKLAEITEKLFPIAEKMKSENKIITEFEFVLAIALIWFSEQHCDYVVLETGLGGRFDATNIIEKPLVSVITSISLDHTKILGDTVAKIAFEKCGIIKPHSITVAYADQPAEAMEVIRNSAAQKNNQLLLADTKNIKILNSDINGTEFLFENVTLKIRLIGEHQIKNACTALYTLKALKNLGVSIPDSAIQKGFAEVSFPARLELLKKEPIVFLDGAHNPGGAAALSAAIRKYLPQKRKIAITGMLADKDIESALKELLPLFDKVLLLSPPNPRAMSTQDLAQIAEKYCPDITPFEDYAEAYEEALRSACEENPQDTAIIIFGSLYLAGEIRKIILQKNTIE